MALENKKKVQSQEEEKTNENLVNPDLLISPMVEEEQPKKVPFIEVLARLAPGKILRTALDDILHAKTGALIVIESPQLRNLFEGGFRVNCKLTPQKIAELSKMDGAIIVSADLKKILFANTMLVPDNSISTNETGTRHKAAERTAKQTSTPVIAVSERRGRITLFYDDKKYILQDAEILLRRATENLHILEKQREICNELLINLNVLEITNLVSISDVCSILQRMEIINRIMNTLKRNIIELGKEGVIIQMRVKELHKDLEDLERLILKDYANKSANLKKILSNINFDSLLNLEILSGALFESSLDRIVYPKGYRMLEKLNLTSREVESLVSGFKNLGNILGAVEKDISQILKQKAASFKRELENLKEQVMVGKKI